MTMLSQISTRVRALIAWVMALPLLVRLAGVLAILAGFGLAAMFMGYLTSQYQTFPARFFALVDGKIQKELFGREGPDMISASRVPTGLIDLELDVGRVETWRPERDYNPLSASGGGMTSFGKDVLLITYSGQVFAATSSSDIRETRITGPDMNREAYQALARDPAMQDYDFMPYYLRYNDLKYFRSGEEHGLIVSYTEYHPDRQCYTSSFARADFDPGLASADDAVIGPEDWTVIYRTSPCLPLKSRFLAIEGHMAGGRMVFSPPSTILTAIGDYHIDGMRSEPPGIAQDPDAEYGKVLSFDIHTGEGRILSTGHRNPQGITLTRDGRLFVAEHGPQGGDELNLIREGANYGWPLVSYGTTYRGGPMPNALSFGRHDGFEPPLFSWLPSIAVSSIVEIEGFHDAWDGDFIIGALTDRSIHRVRLQDGNPIYSERIDIGSRVRHVHQHTDGRIVIWTDSRQLVFVSPLPRDDDLEKFDTYLATINLSDRRKNRLATAIANCAECHSFGVVDHAGAPALGRIFGDPIASTDFANYSSALRSRSGVWSRDNLIAYLSDPQAFAPGTVMPGQQFADAETIGDIVTYLEFIDREF